MSLKFKWREIQLTVLKLAKSLFYLSIKNMVPTGPLNAWEFVNDEGEMKDFKI